MASPNTRRLNLPDVSSLNLPDVVTRIKQLADGKEAGRAAVREMIHLLDVDISDLNNGQDNPAFSAATWKVTAPQFDLNPTRGIAQLEKFEVPSAILPPSFHREVMTALLKWTDVYKARDAQANEAARVRDMDVWHVPVCALFKGRLVDTPESPMPGTEYTSGGEIEHQVSMAEGILLDITEMKLYVKNERDHLAQVLLQLDSAFQKNSGRDLNPQPPIYAVLTDLEKFYFLRHDGHKFCRMSQIIVNSETQDGFLIGMARVSERLFSLLLHAYIGVLTAVERRSVSRGQTGDRVIRDSIKLLETKRPSTDRWSQALAKALAAQDILSACQWGPIQEWEKAENGLKLLFESVRYLDKFGSEEHDDGDYIAHILSRMTGDLKLFTTLFRVLSEYR